MRGKPPPGCAVASGATTGATRSALEPCTGKEPGPGVWPGPAGAGAVRSSPGSKPGVAGLMAGGQDVERGSDFFLRRKTPLGKGWGGWAQWPKRA